MCWCKEIEFIYCFDGLEIWARRIDVTLHAIKPLLLFVQSRMNRSFDVAFGMWGEYLYEIKRRIS
jgi:hypothetical protein